MKKDYGEQARIFKALCDEQRLQIVELLRKREMCACVLSEKLDIPQSSLSYHMKILCESKLVDGRQEGKWTHYKISAKGSLKALRVLAALTGIQSFGKRI